MKGLEGKVALVTGGGGSLGRAIALALAARGVGVVVMGRSERSLGEAVGGIVFGGGRARHVVGDVTRPEALAAAVGRALDVFGRIDLVVAGASAASGEADVILGTDLLGAERTFAAVLPRMSDGGRLIVTSALATAPGAPGHVAREVVREGVVGLVRALAVELAPRRIRCNALVRTAGRADERVRAEAEAAEVAAFLCSDAGDVVTGQILALG